MNEIILKTKCLCKKYKSQYVLNDINMTIRKGDIYDFVGENGAGKTTLIKILTGIAFKSSGEISLFGETSAKNLTDQRMRIGAIVESPAYNPDMTAYENLDLHRIQCGLFYCNYFLDLFALKLIMRPNTKYFHCFFFFII